MSDKEFFNILSDKIDKVAEKQDKIYDEILIIKVTEVKHAASLEEHMRRTELAEKAIEKLSASDIEIYKVIEPVQKHVTMIQGVVKFIGLIGVLVGIIVGLAKIFGAF